MKHKESILVFLYVIASLAWNASASDRQEIDSLINQLGDEALHYDTLRRLAEIGKPAVPELVRVLPQADHELAITIVETLRLMGRDAESAVPTLIAALRQPNFFVQQGHPSRRILTFRDIFNWKCVATLAEIGAPAIPALVETLSDANADIRYYAAEALSYMGYEARPAALALVPLLNDEYDKVREMAALALGSMKSQPLEDITVIFDSMAPDPTLEKRIQADDEMLAKAAIPDLMPMLADENYSIRAAAVHALGTLGGVAAVPALTAALEDRYDKVREAAARALGEIGHPAKAAVPTLINMLKTDANEPPGVRVSVVRGLGGIGTPAAVSALIETVNDQNDWSSYVRRAAISELAEIGEPVDAIVPPLMRTLADSDVCDVGFRALGRIGEPAVPALIEGLSHEKALVRERSALALAQIVPLAEAAVPALIQAFRDDKDEDVRRYAYFALKAIGTPEALKAIEDFEYTPPTVKIPKRAR